MLYRRFKTDPFRSCLTTTDNTLNHMENDSQRNTSTSNWTKLYEITVFCLENIYIMHFEYKSKPCVTSCHIVIKSYYYCIHTHSIITHNNSTGDWQLYYTNTTNRLHPHPVRNRPPSTAKSGPGHGSCLCVSMRCQNNASFVMQLIIFLRQSKLKLISGMGQIVVVFQINIYNWDCNFLWQFKWVLVNNSELDPTTITYAMTF